VNSSAELKSDSPRRNALLRLGLLFGVIYFVQGMSEPSNGLASQPNQSLLRDWGKAEEEITFFAAMLTLPWCLKPLFGLLSDFVPLARYRRKSYLLIASALGVAGFVGLLFTPLPSGAERPLLSWLMLSAIAVVCSDVVIDALILLPFRGAGEYSPAAPSSATSRSKPWRCRPITASHGSPRSMK
jgi:hypothetical protein